MTHPPTEHGRKTLYMTATAILRAERTQDRRKPSEGLESRPVNEEFFQMVMRPVPDEMQRIIDQNFWDLT